MVGQVAGGAAMTDDERAVDFAAGAGERRQGGERCEHDGGRAGCRAKGMGSHGGEAIFGRAP